MTTEHIKNFLISLNNPQHNYKTIHIGGSNGKGSTAFFLYQMLKMHENVGVYMSPYTHMRFDNILYDENTPNEIEALYQKYYQTMVTYQLTPFEMDTAMMYLYFSLKKVNYAVIEVGLGGQDDATNVIHPEIAIITSISLEHQEILGPTIEKIIKVKSGIFKANTKVLISPFIEKQYQKLLIEEAIKVHAEVIPIEGLIPSYFDTTYINQNYAISLKAYQILYPDREPDIQRMHTLPFRFERLTHNIILDGAHNVEGMMALNVTIKKLPKKPIVIMSAIQTKPILEMISILKKHVDTLYLMHFDHPDSYDEVFLKSIHDTTYLTLEDLEACIKQHEYDTIIITGSLYFLRYLNPYLRSITHESKSH